MTQSGKYLAPHVIAEYRAAYARANLRTAPKVTYENGWYIFGSLSRPRFRRRQVEDMTARLNFRSASYGELIEGAKS